MSCCGQKREANAVSNASHRKELRSLAPVAVRATPAMVGTALSTTLRAKRPMVVNGPVTGKQYFFSSAGAMLAVDKRDAEGLAGTGLLERAWG